MTNNPAQYKPYLDVLFSDAEAVIQELSKKNGEFTNYQFIRRASQLHQGAYVALLHEVLTHRGEDYLFNLAHQAMGNQLRNVALKLGYEIDKDTGVKESNIFGDLEEVVMYRVSTD